MYHQSLKADNVLGDSSRTDLRFEMPEINTWRAFEKSLTQEGVRTMVEEWEANGYRFGTVCIDDGWMEFLGFGDWKPCPKRFPDLRGLVDWIHAKGYAVRLWVAPAQIHPGTHAFEQLYPHAVLHNRKGQPSLYAGQRSFRLNIRCPEAAGHIRDTMQRLVRDYAVDAFKVDFPPFYHHGDDFFVEHCDYDLPEADYHTMVPDFYRLVREAVDEVNPSVRVEGAKDIQGCEDAVDDIICGDLIGHERTTESLRKIADNLRAYGGKRPIVPWFEMVWGEGTDYPTQRPEWYAGFLEYLALSINLGMKIEHSFPPFAYPNAEQIRILTNLYGPRNCRYKVLQAGRRQYPVASLLDAGIALGPETRFLVAPEEETHIVLHTYHLRTNSQDWHCRNLLTGLDIPLQSRNEFWTNSTDWCRAAFVAAPRQVYELYYTGDPTTRVFDIFQNFPWVSPTGKENEGMERAAD